MVIDSDVLSNHVTVPVEIIYAADQSIGIREAQYVNGDLGARRLLPFEGVTPIDGSCWDSAQSWITRDQAASRRAAPFTAGIAALADFSDQPCVSVTGYVLNEQQLVQYSVRVAAHDRDKVSGRVVKNTYEGNSLTESSVILRSVRARSQMGHLFTDFADFAAGQIRRVRDDPQIRIVYSPVYLATKYTHANVCAAFEQANMPATTDLPSQRRSPRIDGLGTLDF